MQKEPISRVYAVKRPGFDTKAQALCAEFKSLLGIAALEDVQLYYRYDFPELDPALFEQAVMTVFSEPNQDLLVNGDEEFWDRAQGKNVFAVEYLPGQYDQHADSAAQCVELLSGVKPEIRVAAVYVLSGELTEQELSKIKSYVINPVDSREASLEPREVLHDPIKEPSDIEIIEGFTELSKDALEALRTALGFAMSPADIVFIQDYFRDEQRRDPTITELRVIDTYWSDHCRHTTFLTQLDSVSLPDDPAIKRAYALYQSVRDELYGPDTKRPVTLMDLAVIGTKKLKQDGFIPDLDESEEINACSIKITVDHDGVPEDWLLLFKNETHNHPTEIEPFGGAATCLGGAIRDPLSGRAYVYQAMRLTGAWDPRTPIEKTLEGKLPQRKISKGAADGYSSYGNQIGLATGQVVEVYHPGFLAKRLEVGAVIAAAPAEQVVREVPEPGDAVLLIGGRTGRDGCGGATGSSVAHTQQSIETSGAEVQKGNPVEERKIQRLFRNPELSRKIRRCNDFGAGGVSVAVGELADSLDIDLDQVKKKYDGLDGTELAISESQERMAVVVREEDVEAFIEAGRLENLEVTRVATVTDDGRLKMRWRGQIILDLSREFLNTNGAPSYASAVIEGASPLPENPVPDDLEDGIRHLLTDLNTLSQKGLGEMFDGTIGAGSVLMPYGGIYQLTPQDGMAAKISLEHGDTSTVSFMSYGYAPYIAEKNPYRAGQEAVIRSLSKLAAMGADPSSARLSFQEYFERLGNDPVKWGKPFSALLGALRAQIEMKTPAIGGKDSMSGSFESLSVPPTIISFAVATGTVEEVLSAELKATDSKLYLIEMPWIDGDYDYKTIRDIYQAFYTEAKAGTILSAKTATDKGALEAALLMSFGNKIGLSFKEDLELIFRSQSGGLLFEARELPDSLREFAIEIADTKKEATISIGEITLSLDDCIEEWEAAMRGVYPEKIDAKGPVKTLSYTKGPVCVSKEKFASPRVFIPAFPGTNCETDTAKAFERAGAIPQITLFRNLSERDIEESVEAFVNGLRQAQIVALPGGFSAGDQPDGSGKFIANVFRSPRIKEALEDLLENRDGLMIGICNGFQALIKLGLVPEGKIVKLNEEMPTLTYNKIGRHVSTIPLTRVVSNLSPWLSGVAVGDTFRIPMSHGEGRFVASDATIDRLIENGQIATQYVNLKGEATMDGNFNPNGSFYAVEGITSPDGRILGKMGHSERIGHGLYKNVPGEQDQKIFSSGVAYFK